MTPGIQTGPALPTLIEPWPKDWVGQLLDLHHAATGGLLSGGQLGKLVKPAQKHYPFAVVLAAWSRFVTSPECKYGPAYFLRQMGDYRPSAIKATSAVYRGVLSEDQVRALTR